MNSEYIIIIKGDAMNRTSNQTNYLINVLQAKSARLLEKREEVLRLINEKFKSKQGSNGLLPHELERKKLEAIQEQNEIFDVALNEIKKLWDKFVPRKKENNINENHFTT